MTDSEPGLIFGPVLFAVLVTSWVVTYRLAGGKNVLRAMWLDFRLTRPKLIAALVSLTLTSLTFVLLRLLAFGPR